jgi:competence protein ComEA
MSRRRTDPRELAAVLERLERLRAGSPAGSSPSAPLPAPVPAAASPPQPGWVATDPDPQRPDHARRVARAGLGVRLLDLWRARAFDPGRNGLAVLAVVALMAALGGVWYFVTARPAAGSAVRQSAAPPSAAGLSGSPPASIPPVTGLKGWPTPTSTGSSAQVTSSAVPIVVDVVGKVAAPGVVELSPGARIRDAIEAAGGALPGVDLTALDLASRLSDGQEIFVGIAVPTGTGAQAAGGVTGGDGASGSGAGVSGGVAAGGSSSGIVDLNAASLTDLETLPGVGPVLAQHIVDWRTQHGHFASVSQLQQVSGIGPAKYAALASRVRV